MDVGSVPSWRDLSSFKSPMRVLAQHFLASRERWKAKCMALKEQAKKYRMQLRDLRRSRDHWKQKAKELEKERRAFSDKPTAHQHSGPHAVGPPPAPSSQSPPLLARP
jgi:hypothetical protein